MGACLSSSKIDTRTAGQGQRLGGSGAAPASAKASQPQAASASSASAQPITTAPAPTNPPRKARDASGMSDREQRARAAEERAKALANRGAIGGGTVPGLGGKLSRQLEEQNRRTTAASDGRTDAIPERVVWD
ncbi:hypothetical protein OC842_002879 [Tilletia horrida]|uniref:Uncharacterized protein n=1 Tax=Tilletia horrida TaxID=155126 RepID=A0AAN6GCH2_9BASI|nr:hypothetical protein OC842_002879 [Tilletia horrida]